MIYLLTNIFFSLVALLLALDVVAWWALDLLLRRRGIPAPWRALLGAFMAFEVAGALLFIASRFFPLSGPALAVKIGFSAILIWHILLLGPTLLFLLGYGIAAALSRRRREGGDEARPAAARRAISRRQFIGLAAAGGLPATTVLLTAAAQSQLNTFDIVRMDLPIAGLPPALDGLTIVHLSDLHVGRLTEGAVLDRMVAAINALDADLILVTGDLINYSLADLPHALDLLRSLRSREGLFICEGNHDVMEDPAAFETRMNASGLCFLRSREATRMIKGAEVQFLGLGWTCGRDRDIVASMEPLLRVLSPTAFRVLLAHHPHALDAAAAVGIPLVLSGHTHGGQLMLTRDIGLGPFFFRYWSGLYRRGDTALVVSNGVGNWFPLRVNAPAQIGHLTLRQGTPA